MSNTEPGQQADTLVEILAKLHDSARILQQNNHAAVEALNTVTKARAESDQVKKETDKLRADTDAYWRATSKEIEDMKVLAAQMRKQAQAEYDAHVSRGVADGKKAHDDWGDKARAAEAEYHQKQARVAEIDAEVAKHQAVLDAVRGEMSHLRERLL